MTSSDQTGGHRAGVKPGGGPAGESRSDNRVERGPSVGLDSEYVSQEACRDTLRQYWLTGKTLRSLDTTAFPLKTAVLGDIKQSRHGSRGILDKAG